MRIRHGVTLTEVIDRYLRALQGPPARPSQEVATITGLVPANIDVTKEYREHLIAKSGKPMARLTANKQRQRIGFLRGSIEVPDDFDEIGRKQIVRISEGWK